MLKYYHPIKVEDFYKNPEKLKGGFLITFDDGYRNNYLYALPILKKYNLQACFFVTTGLINTRDFLWTDNITRLIFQTRKNRLKLNLNFTQEFLLSSKKEKENASIQIRNYLKKIHPSKVGEYIAEIKEQLSDVPHIMQRQDEDRYLFMDWNEIKELHKADQIIGSHTHSHPILATLNEKESFQELKVSKELIEKHTKAECNTISYPNGAVGDFTKVQKNQLKSLNYRCAFTQIPLFNNSKNDLFELRRINISEGIPPPMFEAILCGFVKGKSYSD